MKLNLDKKQARFQSDDVPHRLGHTGSNLARVRSFCNTADKDGVKNWILLPYHHPLQQPGVSDRLDLLIRQPLDI